MLFISSNVQERSIQYKSDDFYQVFPDYENMVIFERHIKEFNQLRALYEEQGENIDTCSFMIIFDHLRLQSVINGNTLTSRQLKKLSIG